MAHIIKVTEVFHQAAQDGIPAHWCAKYHDAKGFAAYEYFDSESQAMAFARDNGYDDGSLMDVDFAELEARASALPEGALKVVMTTTPPGRWSGAWPQIQNIPRMTLASVLREPNDVQPAMHLPEMLRSVVKDNALKADRRRELGMGYGNWTPRSTPVEAEDGDLFWVVNEHGKVVPAHWNAYQRGGVFQNLLSNDEGMCGFTVTHYQPIIRPEAPTT